MIKRRIVIKWPNGKQSIVQEGEDWIEEAEKAGIDIPTGCLTGSCGACEIDVNGKTIRACITSIQYSKNKELKVELLYDPYW